MDADDPLLPWLLDTEPALRWRVERDLAGAPASVWEATRASTATEGAGPTLLAAQDADGQWAGGAYFPAGFDWDVPDPADDGGQPYTATTWALTTLREWGVPAAALGDTAARIDANSRWEYDDLPYWGGETDVCINAMTLDNGAWLGVDMTALAGWFVEHQLPDGGWNCEWVEGATVSSFHSTINALRGILDYEQRTGFDPDLTAARRRGEAYLLERRLLHRARDGALVGEWATRVQYPQRWPYTLTRVTDYFTESGIAEGRSPDERLDDAFGMLRAKRRDDGRFVQEHRSPGRTWVVEDVAIGEPSPWVTYFGTRALDWYDGTRTLADA